MVDFHQILAQFVVASRPSSVALVQWVVKTASLAWKPPRVFSELVVDLHQIFLVRQVQLVVFWVPFVKVCEAMQVYCYP